MDADIANPATPVGKRRRWFQYSLLTLLLLTAIVAVVSWAITTMVGDIAREQRALQARHVAATKAIQQIYAEFRRTGQWPAESKVAGDKSFALPADWTYATDGSGAVLDLDGPYHMSLDYRFTPPQDGPPTRTWTFNFEGDKSDFHTTEQY